MKNLEYYFKKAQKEHWALGQFNFSAYSQLKAIVKAAQEKKSPVILGTSEGESKFFGLEEAVALRNVLRKKTGLPIFLNLDHGQSFEYAKQAIDSGYDMVHFDGSKLSFAENIKITKQVKDCAGWGGVLVEGELGNMGTESSTLYDEKFKIDEKNLTDPGQVKEYIKKTGVDALAVSIGTFHGIDISGVGPDLRLDLLKKIKEEAGALPLVMHGGSGTPEDDVKKAISLGIAKVNINTELRLAYSGNLRRALGGSKEITPYKFLPQAQDSAEKVVRLKIDLFGSQNKA